MNMKKTSILLAAVVLLCFWIAVARLDDGRQEEGREQLEALLKRMAVSCYASEGAYPPSVDYLKERYALQYDEERYTIHYELFASNLMPDITVMENGYE